MLIYVAQVLCLAILLWCLSLSSRGSDLFIAMFVCLWAVGVIFLYWHFRDTLDVFYSNDQRFQVHLVQQIAIDGVRFSLDGIIANRYVITIPALLLTKCGIDPLLALKFLQAVFFILTYRLVKSHFISANLRFKLWYLVFFSGPIFIFMSLLGLRDLALAYFSLYTFIGPISTMRSVSWFGALLLRPHLAVALAFGRLVGFVFCRARFKYQLILLPLLVVFSFLCGLYIYVIGSHLQSRANLDFASARLLITQDSFARVFANFGGLQFLLLGSNVIEFSILGLLLLRLIFIDTFLIPLLFTWVIITSSQFRSRAISIYIGFAFFLGVVAHTEFNSSRQNIPFLVLMGATVAEHFAGQQGSIATDKHGGRLRRPNASFSSNL